VITRFVLRWLVNAVAVYVTTLIVRGLQIPEPVPANTAIVALVLGIVNAFIRPVVLLLTLPVNILTLGLFTLIVNTLMLYLVAAVTPLSIAGFWSGGRPAAASYRPEAPDSLRWVSAADDRGREATLRRSGDGSVETRQPDHTRRGGQGPAERAVAIGHRRHPSRGARREARQASGEACP